MGTWFSNMCTLCRNRKKHSRASLAPLVPTCFSAMFINCAFIAEVPFTYSAFVILAVIWKVWTQSHGVWMIWGKVCWLTLGKRSTIISIGCEIYANSTLHIHLIRKFCVTFDRREIPILCSSACGIHLPQATCSKAKNVMFTINCEKAWWGQKKTVANPSNPCQFRFFFYPFSYHYLDHPLSHRSYSWSYEFTYQPLSCDFCLESFCLNFLISALYLFIWHGTLGTFFWVNESKMDMRKISQSLVTARESRQHRRWYK